jgi:hypothetical protein
MDIAELRQKADAGSVVAQTILGLYYLDGTGVAVDYGEAFHFLSAAAEQGAPRAISNLGRMHAEGLGVAKDLAKALRVFETAAEKGEFLAQIETARIYARGVVENVDFEKARHWYSAALRQKGSVIDGEELQEAKAYLQEPGSTMRTNDGRPKTDD